MGILAYSELISSRHEQRYGEILEQTLDHLRNDAPRRNRIKRDVRTLEEEHGISRSKAAEAASACIRPFLPARGEGKTPYKFTGKLLMKSMRDKGPELIGYINNFLEARPE
jgi:hypothetical protein